MSTKPLGHKAYGSIGHLPGSRLGPSDSCVPQGQADICTVKTRDKHDVVFVEAKLDGSCCAVARTKNGMTYALTRAGYHAVTSPYEQHWLFAAWLVENQHLFHWLPTEWRVVGEWVAQAHGTLYQTDSPFFAFDLFDKSNRRLPRWKAYDAFDECEIKRPALLHKGGAIPVKDAMAMLKSNVSDPFTHEPEGVVYRVERKGEVDFLAKWVRPDKQDGIYLPELSGCPAVWNWRPLLTR